MNRNSRLSYNHQPAQLIGHQTDEHGCSQYLLTCVAVVVSTVVAEVDVQVPAAAHYMTQVA